MGFNADFGMAKSTSKVIHLGHFLLFVCFMKVTAARDQFEATSFPGFSPTRPLSRSGG